MNKRRGVFNIIIGIGSQIVTIALGIVIPRLFLTSFGSEMNGFLNSITQIFTYFALLEAGVGATTLQALYGPVAKKSKEDIVSILAATHQYYKKTGMFYFVAVVLLAVVYPLIVDTSISKMVMISIILINGIPGAISYYFQGKYTILLQAEGKNYINIFLTFVASTLTSISKIVLMLLGFNVVIIQIGHLIINLIKVLFFAIYIKKKYAWINLNTTPNFKAIEQKNAALVNQICDLIFRNTDTLILTLFCDLKVVSVYSMYTLLFSMIRTALDYVAQGFSFIMGQTYNSDKKQFIVLHDLYETYRMALVFALYNIAYIFILPFMTLYTAGVNDINYLDGKVALLFVVFYLMTGARACEADLINYAQHFRLTQSRCVIEAIINLSVSLVCVQFMGIYGVLVGTIVALVYRANDMVLYANRKILNRGSWVTYRKWISNAIVFVSISYVTSLLDWNLNSYFNIILWACVGGVIIIFIYFVVASLVNPESFAQLKAYIKAKLKKI